MPNANYFRQQAERCLRLARVCADTIVAERLNVMAAEFLDRAEEYGPGGTAAPHAMHRDGAEREENGTG